MKYQTIVADPPWPYPEGFVGLRGPCTSEEVASGWRPSVSRSLDPLPYNAMTIEDIADLPVSELSDSNCRLFMWATQKFLPTAIGIVAEWGFIYRQTLVWHKISSVSPFGGSVAPNDIEFVLVGRRGSPPVVTRASSCVLATRGNAGRRQANGGGPIKHSRKPEAFLDLVESVSPGPYLELFARRQRLGWDTWGSEALEHVALEVSPS